MAGQIPLVAFNEPFGGQPSRPRRLLPHAVALRLIRSPLSVAMKCLPRPLHHHCLVPRVALAPRGRLDFQMACQKEPPWAHWLGSLMMVGLAVWVVADLHVNGH